MEKLEKNRMKKLVIAHFLLLFLFLTLITPAYASVTIQAKVDRDVHVTFNFGNLNETIYWMIKGGLITESTIPNFILDNLEQQNLTHVDCYTEPIVFDDSALSIHVTFYLSGSDILNVTINTKSMVRTYHLKTDWRKFYLNITGISLNFTEYFGKPVEQWQKINYTLNDKVHPTYYYDFTGSSLFDPLCYFILPTAATNVHAVEDTIIFELPPSFEDSLLNSPFLILGALLIVNIAFFLYRRVRK